MTEALMAGTPIELELEATGSVRPLSNEVEGQIVRIVHEAVINVVKHSQATRVHLSLRFFTDSLCVRLADDGCGFDADLPAHRARGGWGLVGMRERAVQVGATLTVSSVPGSGTTVELVVPIEGV
jgi:signal transduction histidine kinase